MTRKILTHAQQAKVHLLFQTSNLVLVHTQLPALPKPWMVENLKKIERWREGFTDLYHKEFDTNLDTTALAVFQHTLSAIHEDLAARYFDSIRYPFLYFQITSALAACCVEDVDSFIRSMLVKQSRATWHNFFSTLTGLSRRLCKNEPNIEEEAISIYASAKTKGWRFAAPTPDAA